MRKKVTTKTELLDIPDLVALNQFGVPEIKQGTIDAYRLSCHSFIRYSGLPEPVRFEDLTPQIIYGWHLWLEHQDISVHTANSYRRSFKAMIRKCGREDLASSLQQMPVPRRESRAITDLALAKILTHASVRDAAMILFMRDTGVRREVVTTVLAKKTAIWESDQGGWKLAADIKTKGDKRLRVYAGNQTALAVSFWLGIRPVPEAKHLFTTSKGGPLAAQTVNSIFRNLRIKAKVGKDQNIFPHALRHRFAHKMLSEFDAKIVSQLLGHEKVETTLEIYGHRTEEELEQAYFNRDPNNF